MQNITNLFGFNGVGFLIFVIFIFFVLRELFTWYWKLNKIVRLLEDIEENTRPKEAVTLKSEVSE